MVRILISVAAGLSLYPAAVFVSLEPNPANWDEVSRALLLLFSFVAGVAVFTFPGWDD